MDIFHINLLQKNLFVCCKTQQINEKEADDGPFLNNIKSRQKQGDEWETHKLCARPTSQCYKTILERNQGTFPQIYKIVHSAAWTYIPLM